MLSFMIKPTSFHCNIHCDYCFYLEKEAFMKPKSHPYMDEDTLAYIIRQHIAQTEGENVYFTWQGGEPMMMGLAFYRKAIAMQHDILKQYPNKTIHNAIQTNGILISDEWARFLHDEQILIGLSLDGNEQHHDAYRVTNQGHGTFKRVMRALERLKQHDVAFNTLTVINRHNAEDPLGVYHFLKDIGSTFMQFIPVVETVASDDDYRPRWLSDETYQPQISDFSIKQGQYSRFMNTVFDDWLRHDLGKISVQLFESILAAYCGYGQSMCIYQPRCGGENLALEANGDIYQCDHFVYPAYKIGNIRDLSHSQVGQRVAPLSEQKADLNAICRDCTWQVLCYGGCPKHRFDLLDDGTRHNYFCHDYRTIFAHVNPAMNFMASLLEDNQPLSLVQQHLDTLLTE